MTTTLEPGSAAPAEAGATSGIATIAEAAAALRAGTTTSVDLVNQVLAVADRLDAATGMFLDRYTESALAAAEAADADLAAGKDLGPLHGIPLGIKDIITTAEGPTTAQSMIHDRTALAGDAVVVERLRSAGGIVMGKLTTSEFAIGAPDGWSGMPVPRNPWSLEHSPGGSSAGSGVAVAAGGVLGALGTDTGGSIRIPAAYCGITGLMPTFGRVPKSGCVPLGFSLDHIGPMARSAKDCALMLDVMAGYDASDLCAIDVPADDYSGALTGDLTGVRIGVDRLARFGGDAEDPALPGAFDAAVAALAQRGAEIVEIELPFYDEMSTADWVIMLSEALSYHRPDLQSRWLDYGSATRRMLKQGALYSAMDYVQAQRARTVGVQALNAVYETVDLIVTPTAAAGAPAIDALYRMAAAPGKGLFSSIYTGYWDTTGNPVLSLPIGLTAEGLPLGLQIAGRPFEEALVLRAGDAYQQVSDWHLQVPTTSVAVVA
ncbi:amidase [Nocardioides humi]|uniref:Asp-tRNA(Asn)/Glu-tRNA(Gln) amidotransferase GatCAB subunit A n=1 Tax=Nocardioides humi TaxID=449461 RepID=A0ABN1ZTU0_9ACTN|nr:amidase [Nocardioides humi]